MLRLAYIEPESTVDGEGLRYVMFMQGCNHNCIGCHNPQSHDFNGGTLISELDILSEIRNNPILDGITLSGGDPFFQSKELIPLIKEVKHLGLDIWAYTGFTFEQLTGLVHDKRVTADMLELLNLVDVLVDGRFELEKRSLTVPFRGSTNQRLIDVQETLKTNTIIEYKLEEF